MQAQEVDAKLFKIVHIVSMGNHQYLKDIVAIDQVFDVFRAYLLKSCQHEEVSIYHQPDEELDLVAAEEEII